MADIKTSTENIEELKAELESTKAQFQAALNELEQYKVAYKEQGERYNRLFGLFANNVDYFVAGKAQN